MLGTGCQNDIYIGAFGAYIVNNTGILKATSADHILISSSGDQLEIMYFFLFLIGNLKFCLTTPCSFGDKTENVMLSSIPINIYVLCIFIIASSLGSGIPINMSMYFHHSLIPRVAYRVKPHKMHNFRGQGQPVESEKYTNPP